MEDLTCVRRVTIYKFADLPFGLTASRSRSRFTSIMRCASSDFSSSSSGLTSHSHTIHSHHPITAAAAASSLLARDIPGVEEYTLTPCGQREERDKGRGMRLSRDASASRWWYKGRRWMTTLRSRYVFFLLLHPGWSYYACLPRRGGEQRSQAITNSSAFQKTRRCPTCHHILIKPEQKPQLVRLFQNQTHRSKLLARHAGPRRSSWEADSGQLSG
jgi:hypothetical protein